MMKSPVDEFSVLADAGIHERRRPEAREPQAQPVARLLDDRARHEAVVRIGIDGLAVPVDSDLEPGAVEIGNAIEAGCEVDPHRQLRNREATIGGWDAEVEHFLPRRANALADGRWKEPRQPRAAREDEVVCFDERSVDQAHHGRPALLVERRRLSGPIGDGFRRDEVTHGCLNRRSGAQHARVNFEHSRPEPVGGHLRKT